MRGEEPTQLTHCIIYVELPPHARRRAVFTSRSIGCPGITSACAEKRRSLVGLTDAARNYLRMRGEELIAWTPERLAAELPPHARRRAWTNAGKTVAFGITSACAEKRGVFQHRPRCAGNYLRMRGEEDWINNQLIYDLELPPHARRRVPAGKFDHSAFGITSACAEKSARPYVWGPPARNYLRMRGEEQRHLGTTQTDPELPPHARRRARSNFTVISGGGITSACAEKSRLEYRPYHPHRNYLRMRGEEERLMSARAAVMELPPHARRRVGSRLLEHLLQGITSACAEKRAPAASWNSSGWNYLRMRGEECAPVVYDYS